MAGNNSAEEKIRKVGVMIMMRKISSVLFLLMFTCAYAGSLYGADLKSQVTPFCLGPEDVLEIYVWKDEVLTRKVLVRPDGKISFPLIGDIHAQGRTVEELRQAIENKMKAFVPDAPVSVMLVLVVSPKIYVVGKVLKPGVYIMGTTLRVVQALAMAGGITPFANKDNILIIRQENGSQKTFKFDYNKIADGKKLEQNIYLKRGDTVVVP